MGPEKKMGHRPIDRARWTTVSSRTEVCSGLRAGSVLLFLAACKRASDNGLGKATRPVTG